MRAGNDDFIALSFKLSEAFCSLNCSKFSCFFVSFLFFTHIMSPCDAVNPRICLNITFKVNIRTFANSIPICNWIRTNLEFQERFVLFDVS